MFKTVVIIGVVFLLLVRMVNKKLNLPDIDLSPQKDDSEDSDHSYNIEVSVEFSTDNQTDSAEPNEDMVTGTTQPEVEELREWKQTTTPEAVVNNPGGVAAQHEYKALYGLVGKPLAHSTSMVRFNNMFRHEHINAHYDNYETEDIEDIRRLVTEHPTLMGFNVTIPYKQAIIPYLDALDETARAIGAVNTVMVTRNEEKVLLTGYNTDWIGFEQSFGELLKGRHKALILGTGGVAKAVRYALERLGIESRFVSRNSTFEIMGYYELSPSVIEDYDIIINCTPLGMWPSIDQCPDIPYTFLSSQHLLLDVIANPEETLFMKKGRTHGAQVLGGKEMLEAQAVAAWDIWNKNRQTN